MVIVYNEFSKEISDEDLIKVFGGIVTMRGVDNERIIDSVTANCKSFKVEMIGDCQENDFKVRDFVMNNLEEKYGPSKGYIE